MKPCVRIIILVFAVLSLAMAKAEIPLPNGADAANSQSWTPLYTGNEPFIWPYGTAPWALSLGSDNWQTTASEIDTEATMNRYGDAGRASENLNAAFEKYGMQADYGGCYINDSKTLTVLLKNPTEVRAQQYADICGAGIWIIEAEYSYSELEAVFAELHEICSAWYDVPSHASGGFMQYGSINVVKNRIDLTLGGRNARQLGEAIEASDLLDCIDMNYPKFDVSQDCAATREPETDYSADKYSLYMLQDSYPAGAESVCFVLETTDGRMMDYVLDYRLDKEVDGQFEEAPSDWATQVPGTAIGRAVIEYKLDKVRTLGGGLYRLSTGMGDLEFIVAKGAPQPIIPEEEAHLFEIAPHKLNYPDAMNYSSCEDDTRAGDRLLIGDRFFWLHESRTEDVETVNAVRMILSAPVDAPEEIVCVYGPTHNDLGSMNDLGDGLLFIEYPGDSGAMLQKLSYDGSALETLSTRKTAVRNAIMIGDKLYYCDANRVYRYDFEAGRQQTVFSTDDSLEEDFACAQGKLIVPVTDWDDEEDGGGIFSVDIQTLDVRRLTQGRSYSYAIANGKIYTWLISKKINATIPLDGGKIENASSQPCSYEQVLPDGLLVRIESGDGWSREDTLTLIKHDGTIEEGLPIGLFSLGNQLWVEDGDGNIFEFSSKS